MLCSMKDLLYEAGEKNCAVGAFSVGNMEMVAGVIRAAEESQTPVILQIAEVRLKHSPLRYMGPMMVQAAREANVKVAVHLDHGLTRETLETALALGFTSIMFDGSNYPLEENITRTREAAALAKQYNAALEAELGMVGGSEDGSENHAVHYTDPAEAKRFAEETGIDALAVAIGNAHGNYRTEPQLNYKVLQHIRENTEIPLVLHGGTGILPSDFRRCIDCGIRKINIATASFTALTHAAYDYLTSSKDINYFSLGEAMTRGVYENVANCIRIFNNKEPLDE